MEHTTPITPPSTPPLSTLDVSLAKYESVSTVEIENKKGWVAYGIDNLYPNYLIELAQNVPVHGALVSGIAQMVAGIGVESDNPNANKFLRAWDINEQMPFIAFDLKCNGGFYLDVIKPVDQTLAGFKVAKVNHLPFENMRLAFDEESGKVTGAWYSRDWENANKKRNKPCYIPMWDDVKDNVEQSRGIIFTQLPTAGSMYYPKPDYIGGLHYIEMARQIAVYHLNNIQNGLFPSFIIQFNNGQPDAEKAQVMKRDIERSISGAKNAGKFIMLFNESSQEAAQFESFPINDADKQYQFLSEESDKKIFVSHRVTTPLIFGIRDGSGLGSNTDEMTQGLEIMMNKVIAPMRKLITRDLQGLLQNEGIEASVTFIDESILDVEEIVDVTSNDTTVITDAPTTEAVSKADVSYNGAQISSAIDIIAKVKEGILTQEQAIVFLIQFLQLPTEVASAFFGGGDAVSNLRAYLGEEKKKICCSHAGDKLTAELEAKFVAHFQNVGEVIDGEEWDLVDEQPAHDTREDEEAAVMRWMDAQLAGESSYANGEKRTSKGLSVDEGADIGLYKIRYQWAGNTSDKTREFCLVMDGIRDQGLVFRYEDIQEMSDDGVNGQFAPQGQTSYDIFLWKGGVYCHHYFKRLIYFRKREKGKFLPNDGLKNDKRVGNVPFVKKKGFESVKPIDTPTRGSLKYS